MSRRRRQRNPLITRILGITVLAHIIILPILAHFGAFKNIKHDLVKVSLMSLPPPAQKAPPPPKKKVVKKAKKKTPDHKTQGKHVVSHHYQQKNLTQPKVVAGKGGSGGGPSITNNGTAAVGQLPTQVTTKPAPPVKPVIAPPVVQQKPTPVVIPKKQPTQIAQVPTAPVVPVAPVIVDAVPALSLQDEPQPEIPRDLRDEAFNKTCVVEVNVSANGTPTSATVLQSSGIDRLDRRAIDAAKKWKFNPATSNGIPIASIVRLHIAFEVN